MVLAFVAATAMAFSAASSYDALNASTDASGYDASRALFFVRHSAAAYCDADSIDSWTCKPCVAVDPSFKAKAFTNSSTNMQAFVGVGSDYILVAFRGTFDLTDWLYNLNFPKETEYPKCGDCKVHQGFYEAWMSLAPGVIAETKRLVAAYPSRKLFVTGHSLGAAMAAHCAAELGASSHSLGFPIEAVYTYGQPRVGNKAFADFYMTGTRVSWRLTHHRDIVAHLPLESMGFHHIGTEVFYSEDMKLIKVCDGSGEDASCSDQFDFDMSVDDHLAYFKSDLGGDVSRVC